jgi:hypothetical protein
MPCWPMIDVITPVSRFFTGVAVTANPPGISPGMVARTGEHPAVRGRCRMTQLLEPGALGTSQEFLWCLLRRSGQNSLLDIPLAG